MKQRILVAVVGVPFLLFVLCWCPDWATALLLSALSVIGAYELLCAVCGNKKAKQWFGLSGLCGIFVIFLSYGSTPQVAVLEKILLAAFAILIFVCAVVKYGKENSLTFLDISTIFAAGIAIPLALSCLLRLRQLPYGGWFVLMPLVAAFCSDSAALFAGMSCGKRKLAPSVSPKKTVEGAIGGLAGGMLGMVIFRIIFFLCTVQSLHIGWCILIGLLGAAMGQLGDLSFSLIKREYSIKDYGRLLPGHGGVLDRFDSVIFAAPLIWLIVSSVALY